MFGPVLVWSTAPTRAAASFAPLRHGATRYQVAGPLTGAPVLLVHGLTYPMEVWTGQFEHLVGRGFRVCRYDLYGRGLSSYDGAVLTPEVLAEQMLQLLDWVEFEQPVCLVSLSNSDLLLAELAARHPRRVRQLVWLAPSGWDARTMRRSTRLLLGLVPWAPRLLASQVRRRCALRMEQHRQNLSADASEAVRSAYELSIRSVKESPAFVPAVLSQVGALPTLKRLTRTLAAVGAQGTAATVVSFRAEADATEAGVEVLRAQLPHCQFIALEGSHMGLLEHPQSVNAALERALLSSPLT